MEWKDDISEKWLEFYAKGKQLKKSNWNEYIKIFGDTWSERYTWSVCEKYVLEQSVLPTKWTSQYIGFFSLCDLINYFRY